MRSVLLRCRATSIYNAGEPPKHSNSGRSMLVTSLVRCASLCLTVANRALLKHFLNVRSRNFLSLQHQHERLKINERS